MLELLKKTNIDFMGKRKYAFIFSGIMVALGIAAFLAIFLGKADLGIDFTGGTVLQGYFEKEVTIGELRAAMSRNGYDASIQSLHREVPHYFLIRVKSTTDDVNKVAEELLGILEKEIPGNKFHKDSVDGIGPSAGKTLQKQARLAVLLAAAGMLIYIWIRFDFRFGVAATVATFHDVFVVLAIFFVLHKEITLLVVSALLTLVGYSINDKVVVFDRIRENLRLFRKRGDFISTLNISINEVLSRTLITGITVLFSLLVIIFIGGEVIHDFALALFLGIIIGTYSSIYIGSPIVLEWERRAPKRFK